MEQITIDRIERETDKALLVVCGVEVGANKLTRSVWFPKSQVTVEGSELNVPAWLANAKLRDMGCGSGWFI